MLSTSEIMTWSPRSSLWALGLLVVAINVALASGQSCSTLVETYQLEGTITFLNTSALGAACVRIIPQPSNKAQEVRAINFVLDSDYDIGINELTYYSTWFPTETERYIAKDYSLSCCEETNVTVRSPIVVVSFNITNSGFNTFSIRFSASDDYRTKFSMGLFQGAIVAFGLPILMLTISLCTFRRGLCNEAGKARRLSRKSPLAEKVATFIACGVGMLFFFLLTFRVFG